MMTAIHDVFPHKNVSDVDTAFILRWPNHQEESVLQLVKEKSIPILLCG